MKEIFCKSDKFYKKFFIFKRPMKRKLVILNFDEFRSIRDGNIFEITVDPSIETVAICNEQSFSQIKNLNQIKQKNSPV